jgi:integrase
LKTFLNYAKRKGIEVNDGFKEFSIKKEKLEVIALSEIEFQKLVNHDLSNNKRLDQVRDIFVFSCATGYRYSDLEQLQRHHIKDDEIRLVITKTKEPSIVPLNQYSRAILEKYSEHLAPLPMISNQKLNKYIKELCELVEEAVNVADDNNGGPQHESVQDAQTLYHAFLCRVLKPLDRHFGRNGTLHALRHLLDHGLDEPVGRFPHENALVNLVLETTQVYLLYK